MPYRALGERKEVDAVKRRLITTGAALCLFVLFPSYLSAGLNSFQSEIIKIAFMNGFVRALYEEEHVLREIKGNKQIMEKVVNTEAEKYMEEVTAMNRRIENKHIQGGSSETFRHNNNW